MSKPYTFSLDIPTTFSVTIRGTTVTMDLVEFDQLRRQAMQQQGEGEGDLELLERVLALVSSRISQISDPAGLQVTKAEANAVIMLGDAAFRDFKKKLVNMRDSVFGTEEPSASTL